MSEPVPESPPEASPPTDEETDARDRHLYAVSGEAGEDPPGDAAAEPGETDASEPGRAGQVYTQALGWASAAFAPQSGLYTERPLAPAELVQRSRHGTHVAEHGPARRLSTVYGYVSAGITIGLRSGEWVLAHPARLGMVTVLAVLAVAFPPTRHLLGLLTAPLGWAQHGLTD